MIVIGEMQAQQFAPNPESPERVTSFEGVVSVAPGEGSASVTLPDGRVLSVLVQSSAEAEALAAARIARGDSDLLAADCRPVAHAVADALVSAGLGV